MELRVSPNEENGTSTLELLKAPRCIEWDSRREETVGLSQMAS